MNKLAVALMFVFVANNSFAQYSKETSTNESVFTKKQKLDAEGVELYATNYDLKATKKIGMGLTLGGATGLLALNGEVMLDPAESLFINLGAGPSYGTFGLGWKHSFEGTYISLNKKVGISKCFSSSNGSGSAADSDVLKRVFSDDELRANHFDADFILGGTGIEYNQLEGDLAGVNFFGEVVLMAEMKKFTFIPTGSVGLTYYY
ncbi:MAG: hypothetical protein H7061_12845 [Bdellovibrionaceae bacterium]|nr:hypothetical protein [Bdellovibrio sp.]